METVKLFGLMAGGLMTITTIIYITMVVRGGIKPNPATWLITVCVMSINAGTYVTLVKKDLWSGAIAIVVACSALLMVGYSSLFRRFAPVSKLEKLIGAISITLLIVWKVTGNAMTTNMIVQGIAFVSLFPMIIGISKGTTKESLLPWSLGLTSYCLQIIGLVLAQKELVLYVYPVINGVIGHSLVISAILIHHSKKPV